MSDIWVPGVQRITDISGGGGGSMTGGPPKHVLHSTEGSWEGSLSVFRSKLTSPHFLIDPTAKRIAQLIPLNRSGYALRNESGGVQTNTDGAIQWEIVMFAKDAPFKTDAFLAYLGEWIAKASKYTVGHINLSNWAPILSYPDSYGDSPVRMSQSQWDNFNGVCYHMSVPENDHGDPGALNVQKLRAYTLAGGDDVTKEDLNDIREIVQNNADRVIEETQDAVKASEKRIFRAVWKSFGKTEAEIDELEVNLIAEINKDEAETP